MEIEVGQVKKGDKVRIERDYISLEGLVVREWRVVGDGVTLKIDTGDTELREVSFGGIDSKIRVLV